MWFLFGFISLIGFTYIAYRQRINTSWKGDEIFSKEGSFEFKKNNWGKFYKTELFIGVDAPAGYNYTFKKETIIDRFFKVIGLSKEYHTGDSRFDDLIYIVSEKAELERQLASNKVIRGAIIDIFEIGKSYNCKVVEICHNSGKL